MASHMRGSARILGVVFAIAAMALPGAAPASAASIQALQTSKGCLGPACGKGDLPSASGSGLQLSTAASLADPFDPAQTLGVWYESPTGGLNSLMTLEFAKGLGGGKLAISNTTGTGTGTSALIASEDLVALQVPEPGALLLLAVGLLFAARSIRRRYRTAA